MKNQWSHSLISDTGTIIGQGGVHFHDEALLNLCIFKVVKHLG